MNSKKPTSFGFKSSSTKKYGLVIPKKRLAAKAAPPSIFNTTNDQANEEQCAKKNVNNQLSLSSKRQSQIDKTHQEALKEDPLAFDYDGAFEEIQKTREEEQAKAKIEREKSKKKSRYISTLLEKSKVRERENERIREKILLKERKEEDHLYGDKEKFITSAYKKKLIEQERWEKEDKRLAAKEAAEDATKRKDGMNLFYSNLLKNNISMGGDVSKSTSAYTVGSSEHNRIKESVEIALSSSSKSGNNQDTVSSKSVKTGEALPNETSPENNKKRKLDESGGSDKSSSTQYEMKKNEIDNTVQKLSNEEQLKTKTDKLSKQSSIDAARARYLARKTKK